MLNPLLLILAGIVVEVMVWIGVAHVVSGWWIFLWTAIAFVWGLSILRSSVSHIMPQLQQMQMTGQLSTEPQVQKSLAKALIGFLLLLPGLVSDVVAALLLIPAVQRGVQRVFMNAIRKRQQAMMETMMKGMGMKGMGGMAGMTGQSDMMAEMMRRMQEMNGNGGTAGTHRPTVIDGEARTIEPEVKRIQPANDD